MRTGGRCTMGMFLLGDPWSSFQSQQRLWRPCACLCSNAQSGRRERRRQSEWLAQRYCRVYHRCWRYAVSDRPEPSTLWKDATCQQIFIFQDLYGERAFTAFIVRTLRNHMWPQVHYSINTKWHRDKSNTWNVYSTEGPSEIYITQPKSHPPTCT